MGKWKKSPKADPQVIAALQAQINSDPQVQAFKAGFGSPNDPWTRGAGGKVRDPNQFAKYVKQRFGASLPDGYDVSQDGEIVYTNKTPALQQAAWASLPIAAVSGAGALMSAYGGPTAGAVTAGAGPAGGIPIAYTAGATVPNAAALGTTVATTAAARAAAAAAAARGGSSVVSTIRNVAGKASARDWLNAAIFGTQTVADLYAASRQAGASTEAARIQAESAQKALDFLKEQWRTDQANFKPYLDLGSQATGQLRTSLAGTSAPPMPRLFTSDVAPMGTTFIGEPRPMSSFGQPRTAPPDGASGPVLSAGSASLPAGVFERPPSPVRTPSGAPTFNTMPVPGSGGSPMSTFGQSTVTLRSPDGVHSRSFQIGDPAIAHYLAQGAQRMVA